MVIKRDELQAQITYRLIESLSASEKRYETLVENLREVVFESDLKGTFKFLNKAWESTLGCTLKESLGRSIYDFVFEDDKESCLKLFDFGKEQRPRNKQDTLRFLHKKGHLLWFIVSVRSDGAGNLSGSLHDITELRETTVSKDYVDNIVNSMIDTLIVVDPDGKMKTINPSTMKLLGYTEDELIDKTISKIISPTQASASADTMFGSGVLKELMDKGFIKDREMIYLTKDKNEITMSFSGAVMKDDKGETQGVVCVAKDLSEVKKLLTDLDQIYNGAPSGMRVVDKDFNIMSQNEAMKALSHMSEEESKGKKCYEQFKGAFCHTEKCPLTQILAGKEKIDVEVEKENPDGTRIPCRIQATPFRDPTGNIVGMIETYIDITEHKKAEEQIKASLKEKEVLLREIHHRVKNNLQVISSLLKLQSQHIDDKQYVEMCKESQNRVKSMALIHEMLYQSKHLSKINFKDYIRTLTNYLFRSCGACPGKIALKIDSENVYLAIDNAIPCGLIINELVSNSLKHAFPDGKEGEIKIALHSINKEDIELVVRDDGVGIPEGLDFRNTKSLGLHLVVILAEDQLHGEIKLGRNKGTEFQIKLRGVK